MRFHAALFIAAALVLPRINAQMPGAPAAGPQPVMAPAEGQPDGTIVFKMFAPTATDVQVVFNGSILGKKKYPLTKGANGLWTGTAGPFEPEMYQYSFLIGGARVNAGTVIVPGNPPRPYEVQNVPHGSITILPYFSKVQNRARAMYIYLPAEYYTDSSSRFPVLYLFNGMGEDGWTHGEHADVIADNLIAEKKAVPMIIVMPNNTVGPVPVPALENAAIMGKEIMGEIIPFIDKTYRTVTDRDHRGIAGLSFGGGTALTVGMRHLEAFAYIAEFGTGAFGGAEHTDYAPGYSDYDPDKIAPGMYQHLTAPATKPKLFFMSVGTEDPRNPYQKAALTLFQKNGIEPVFKTFPGGHELRVFRNSFTELLPMLFK